MSIAIQWRRGTTANHSGFAGLMGEVTVDTTLKTLRVHDGSTLGGTPLALQVHTHTVGSITGLTYQVVQISGTAQPTQYNLNFSSLFTASNDTPNQRTTVTLANNNTSGAGTYGSATQVPQLVLNANGLITSVTPITIAGVAPGGGAGGDLKNTYPNPGVASVGGASATDIAAGVAAANAATSSATNSTIVKREVTGNFSANVITAALTGNVTGSCSGTAGSFTGNLTGDVTSTGMATTLKTANSSPGTYGSSSAVAQVTVDAQGRVTAAQNVTITGFLANGSSAGGDLGGTFPSPTVTQVNGVLAATVSAGVNLANAATTSNTASTIVLRDGSGSAGFTNTFFHKKSVTGSATPSFDFTLGTVQQMTISASISSMTLSGLTADQLVIFDFVHDNTANAYTIAWAANVYGGGANVGTANNKHNIQLFWCDGSSLYALGTMRTDLGA